MPVIKSAFPDFEEDLTSSVPEYVLRNFAVWGDAQALVDGPSGKVVTYNELLRAIKSIARGLQQAGLKKGDVVAVWMPNSIEYVYIFHGTIMAGGVLTTLNPTYTGSEAAHQFENADAVYLVTASAFLEKVSEAAAMLKNPLRQIYVVGGSAPAGMSAFSSLDVGGEPAPVNVDPGNDVCVLPYSSGTTGLSKGTMLTHRNLVVNIQQSRQPGVINEKDAHDPSDTLLAVLPFYHIYGMVVVMNLALACGARLVIMPGFEPNLYLKLLGEYKVTVAYLAPPLAQFLAKSPTVKAQNFPHLRDIFSAAAPLGPELTLEVQQKFPGVVVRQGYGMTELSPVAHVDSFKNPTPGAVGYLVPNMEAKIVDPETGNELQQGTEKDRGELWLRGTNVMKGYLKNEEATRGCIDSEGWLHTGDICYCDPRGCFFIVDRLKELIKAKGFQVAPAELEAILAGHPEVFEAAVIGVPAEKYGGREGDGEVPKAFVLLQGGSTLTPAALAEWLRPKVAEFKQLSEATIQFVESIPKLPSGKILRKDLRVMEKELPGKIASKL